MEIIPNTDNFFKYILTIGVLMILFGLIYPLKQEQLLRTRLIEIKEHDSLLKVEIKYLEIKANDLNALKEQTQIKINELKHLKSKLPIVEQINYDEKIISLADKFNEKKEIGLNIAREAKLKSVNLQHEQLRFIESQKQINEYFVFKSLFWGLGAIFMLAGLFFWMDSTYFEERIKAADLRLQPPYSSKYILCLSFFKRNIIKYQLILLIIIIMLLILVGIWILIL